MNVVFLPFPKYELERKSQCLQIWVGGGSCWCFVSFFFIFFFSLLKEINHVICCPLEFIIFFKTQTFLSKCTEDKKYAFKGPKSVNPLQNRKDCIYSYKEYNVFTN